MDGKTVFNSQLVEFMHAKPSMGWDTEGQLYIYGGKKSAFKFTRAVQTLLFKGQLYINLELTCITSEFPGGIQAGSSFGGDA